jgi:hypothetical protein
MVRDKTFRAIIAFLLSVLFLVGPYYLGIFEGRSASVPGPGGVTGIGLSRFGLTDLTIELSISLPN